MSSKYNLDDEDKFIVFTIFGHEYQFWYPTTEQEEVANQKKIPNITFLVSLVKKPEGAEYSEFTEAYKKMNVKEVSRFTQMILTEIKESSDGEDKSTET